MSINPLLSIYSSYITRHLKIYLSFINALTMTIHPPPISHVQSPSRRVSNQVFPEDAPVYSPSNSIQVPLTHSLTVTQC